MLGQSAISEVAISSIPEIPNPCPCCDFIESPCCPDRRLPSTLFGTMLDGSVVGGDCSCSNGKTFIFRHSNVPVQLSNTQIILNDYWVSDTTAIDCVPFDGPFPPPFQYNYNFYLTCDTSFGDGFWILHPLVRLSIDGFTIIFEFCGSSRIFPNFVTTFYPLCRDPFVLLFDQESRIAPLFGGQRCCNGSLGINPTVDFNFIITE